MSIGPWQIAIIVILVLVFFGRGKISEFMGDMGRGVTSFKKGLNEGKEALEAKPQPQAEAPAEKESAKSE